MMKNSSHLDRCPAFFKVYLPHICSLNLQIPSAFESKIKGELPEQCIIRGSRGVKWKVKIQRDEEGLFFKDGWSKFVQDNSLEHGEFLVFYYDHTNSSFTVKLFTRDCCEKKSKLNAMSNPVRFATSSSSSPSNKQREVKQEASLDVDEIRDKHRSLNRKRKSPCESSEKSKPNNGPLEAAYRYNPEHPSFTIVLKEAYVGTRPFLHVPSKFWRSYMDGGSRGEIWYSGKCWKVELYFYETSYSGRMSTGWKEFVRDNKLQVGDVCIFELIKLDTFVFRMSLFR